MWVLFWEKIRQNCVDIEYMEVFVRRWGRCRYLGAWCNYDEMGVVLFQFLVVSGAQDNSKLNLISVVKIKS